METLPGLGRLPDVGDQGELLSVGAGPREIVGEVRNPVAHVHVELHQPHLDKVFDYLVPAAMDAAAVPGVRVSVDVAGLRASGFVVARDSASSTGGRLRPLRRVVSALPVLTGEVYGLARRVPPLPYGPPIAKLVAAQLREVGIEANVEELDFSTWLSQVYTQHDYDMTVVAHVEPWDLSQFANPNYYWQYNNPQFAELINKADAAATNTEQEATLKEAAKLLADDAAADWLFLLPNLVVTTTEISGITTNTTGLSFDMTHVATSR